VSAFPDQAFVVDHVAKPYIREGRLTAEWKDAMRALAAHENVYCKISGMVTEADWKGWTAEQLKPYVDTIVEVFGMSRVMFGSDWPVCLVAASYRQWFELLQGYFSPFSASEREAFFGGNAKRFYNL
jgi:L-fuconolactonase